MTTLLVANRGEIAVRVIRTAKEMGITTVAVHPRDDAESLHVRLADRAIELTGIGPAAYLDSDQLVAAAKRTGARLVHPGYGFLAESADFASRCREAGLTFLGPSPEALARAGSKPETRALAVELGIHVPAATGVLSDGAAALELLDANPAGVVLKAVAGGGGRGIAIVTSREELPDALARCRAEALHGFGDDRVFAEQLLTGARHIEVQGIGGPDGVSILGDRDCSLQRRRQKLVEIAPAPYLDSGVRAEIHDATRRLLHALRYKGLATVEFLVTGSEWALLEINPRIQVEHTITEAITGFDLVECQIELGLGRTLRSLGLTDDAAVPGSEGAACAIQLRIAAETMGPEGSPKPSSGPVSQLGFPTGPGVRVDTWLQPGATVGLLYDTLLAKVVVAARDPEGALRRAQAAINEFVCVGVDTNAPFLSAVLEMAVLGRCDTGWIDDHMQELLARSAEVSSHFLGSPGIARAGEPAAAGPAAAVAESRRDAATYESLTPGEEIVVAPVSGTVVSLVISPGELGLIESMKMHHPIPAPPHARARPLVAIGDTVTAGQPVFAVFPDGPVSSEHDSVTSAPHPGIAEVKERHERVLDAARPAAVAKVHARSRRTARENLADLVVPGSFVEYGPLVIAAQTARRPLADLIDHTSGDGLVGGIGLVNTPAGPVRAVVMSYDYMVLAGTQGARNHAKTDRLLQVASSRQLPVVLFAEGGGGRPGDTDVPPGAHLNVQTFAELAALRGRVPIVAIVSGRCFAGNAALAGVADLIIATADANIGMGGPAMVEGGGLGKWTAEDIGPAALHARTGVVDVLVEDDAGAVLAAQQFLGHFRARTPCRSSRQS
ncbi:biotin carboxylase N-terminal domain-containing protein [Leucobacter komagatae]|uniref:ATP-binding protein n=1 Tax=Leucobacter komagatae TaxID=55969 RepID=UPI001B883018|nr:biotin carboxylase N-terminal domain-containing protein [Leucobacter komagatae]